MDFNNVMISGKIVSDIDVRCLRQTNDGRLVLNFKVRCLKDNKNNEYDWIDCTAFGNIAKNIVKYLHKNDDLLMEGRLCSEKYHHNGIDKYRMYLLVKKIKF